VRSRLSSRIAGYALAAFALGAGFSPASAAGDRLLQHLRGDAGYRCEPGTPPTPVGGTAVFRPGCFAITGAQSSALLRFPDGSIVGLGESTSVQPGAPNLTPTTVAAYGGTLRFDMRPAPGSAPNYQFATARSLIAVRGAVGLIAVSDGQVSVACLACAADALTVTVNSQPYPVLSGQLLTSTTAGVVTTVPLTAAALAGFAAAGVSTSAQTGPVAAADGVH
jgi:hypothetical protein